MITVGDGGSVTARVRPRLRLHVIVIQTENSVPQVLLKIRF